ncbi:MAG TPA: GGDEF domain-containing protein [Noviherbaspirillum sp.]|nr:GGDEF domain-containing protein [Noviherbaspirillum sp.]
MSENRVISLGVVGVALVALADAALNFEISLVALHMLPVLVVTWYTSLRWGMFILVLMTVITVLLTINFAPPASNPLYRYLDLSSDFVAMMLLVFVQSRLREAYRTVRRQSRTDVLTGCLNRSGFHEQLQAEVVRQKRYGHAFSLLYLDVDNFKTLNDTQGHQAGDALLTELGRLLLARLRKTDSAGRLGGDEFAVLLRETGLAAAQHIADEMKAELERTSRGHRWPVGFSIGIVCFSVPPASADEALHRADELMYEAKRGGKNTLRARTV